MALGESQIHHAPIPVGRKLAYATLLVDVGASSTIDAVMAQSKAEIIKTLREIVRIPTYNFLSHTNAAQWTEDSPVDDASEEMTSASHALSDPESDPPPRKEKAVLGRETLKAVRADIATTRLPSWIGRAPVRMGSKRQGKLSADEWRTACTVNLVITLGRLWAVQSASDRQRRMLENFMDLVTATKLATMRSLNAARIKLYHAHMMKYLQGFLELYPDAGFKPNQHISLHLTQMLRDFGPTHAWRCFPFERLNSILQSIDTNKKFGKFLMITFNHNFVHNSCLLSKVILRLQCSSDSAWHRTFVFC